MRSTLAGSAVGLLFLAGSCTTTTRFPLRAPLLKDSDDRPFTPAPEEYESPFAWDAANQTVFRPIARLFAVDPAGPALNVNAFDEVPDSSWFTHRLGRVAMTPEQVAQGPCDARVLDPNMPDGSWVIDKGKDNGANPGFRVNIEGLGKFMLKPDLAEEPERATGATAIASRIYHAVGYFAPCDSVVYFRPSILRLKPGLTVTNNQRVTTPFDAQALARILRGASHRGGLVRMVASQWLPGEPLGPYRYDGLRDDDPNDVIPHEDRRELRGARLVAAWVNHFDAREQNTMDVFLPADPSRRDGPGHVRHYIMDLGDCFGSVWSIDAFSRQFGHAYLFDVPYVTEDFVTLGTIERPWERARRVGGTFNYFSARDFDPDLWRGEYPNPAFGRMTEADGAWMARILAHFDDDLVAAAVRVGQYDAPSTQYLTQTLIQRRDAILKRYLSRLSPMGGVHVVQEQLCGTDLARRSRTVPQETVSFSARRFVGAAYEPEGSLRVVATSSGRVCVPLLHHARHGGAPDADPSRYLVVDVSNGYSRGPLRAHLYDLGPKRGFQLVGIERPEDDHPPD
ncbi:MAG: hypothetical protein JW940_26285 [Polyangiaceae bacterium]|nr:hypothetical protein [Polyangiaceae bacterium]